MLVQEVNYKKKMLNWINSLETVDPDYYKQTSNDVFATFHITDPDTFIVSLERIGEQQVILFFINDKIKVYWPRIIEVAENSDINFKCSGERSGVEFEIFGDNTFYLIDNKFWFITNKTIDLFGMDLELPFLKKLDFFVLGY